MEHLEELTAHASGIDLLKENAPSRAAKAIFAEQMGVDEDMMRKILKAAMSLGGDFADLFFEYALRNSIILEEGIIKIRQKLSSWEWASGFSKENKRVMPIVKI